MEDNDNNSSSNKKRARTMRKTMTTTQSTRKGKTTRTTATQMRLATAITPRMTAGSLGSGDDPGQKVQIAIMLRSDVFRQARARSINSIPGPAELFRIVNAETAKQLSEKPLWLPDLKAVLAENR